MRSFKLASATVICTLGLIALVSPPSTAAAADRNPFCDTPICSTSACDEENIEILCSGLCPEWAYGVCWEDVGHPPCLSNEYKYVCHTDPM